MRILPVCLDFLYLITKKGCTFKKITAKFGSIMQYCLLKPLWIHFEGEFKFNAKLKKPLNLNQPTNIFGAQILEPL